LPAALFVLGASWSAPAASEAPAPRAAETDAEQPAANIVITRYRVEISGAPKHVGDIFRDVSQLLQLQNKPPATVAALRRRIAGDEDRFRAALESEGY
jgi:hypothetical protein